MNPLLLLAILLTIVSGGLAAAQAPTNAMLARALFSPINAALASFAVGTVALLLIAIPLGIRPDAAATRALPAYAWFGGLYGAFFVAAAAFSAPKMGITFYVTALIAGQIVVALLIDQYGAFGVAQQPITAARVIGVLLLLAGVFLARR
jgi:bacterial/archaeal transporter family-2 protein